MQRRGLTLIEVVIALVVSAALFSAAVPLIYNTITANREAKLKLNAYQAAHKEIENVKNVDILSITSHTFSVPDVPNSSGNFVVTRIHDELDEIKSTVTWTFHGKTQTAELKTYIYGETP